MSILEPSNSVVSDSDDAGDGLGLENLFQAEEHPEYISFDMWGSCRVDNFQAKLEENRRLKPLRVHLMKLVTDYLNTINVSYSIYGGTALSVYREGGKMIEHDSDIDLAIMETDFSKAIKNIDSFIAVRKGDVRMSQENTRYARTWFDEDGKEILYNGRGAKSVKFFATKKLFTEWEISVDESFDIHVDVFTLGQHPEYPNCLCVNWNFPGYYDYTKKAFPKSIFFPLKRFTFEGLEVYGMNDLKAYLEIEYGYLGRGATYDSETQLYVKIPESAFEKISSF